MNKKIVCAVILFLFLHSVSITEKLPSSFEGPHFAFEGNLGTQYWALSLHPATPFSSTPVIADIDLDTQVEIVILDFSGNLKCLYGVNGTVKWTIDHNDPIYTSIIAANIDDEPSLELICNSGGRVIVRSGINGSIKWQTGIFSNSPISVGDIDTDGKPDIITTSGIESTIYCLNSDGTVKYNPLQAIGILTNHQMALVDADKDNQTEIIVANDNNKILSLRGTTGIIKWQSNTFEKILTPPYVLDLDHDKNIDIVFGTNGSMLYVLNGVNGSIKWQKNLTNGFATDVVSNNLLIGDVNKDNNYEIFYGTQNMKYICLKSDGEIKWTFNLNQSMKGSGCLCDIDGDFQYEVLFIAESTLYCLNADTGDFEWAYALIGSGIGFVECVDVDLDGKLEIIALNLCSPVLNCLIGNGKPWLLPSPVPCYGGSQFHTGDYQDKDNDLIPNQLEKSISTDPNIPDTDQDALTDFQEVSLCTNPIVKDTDADGLPDGWEVQFKLNPLNSEDATMDYDSDFSNNLQEYARNTDPNNRDTDGDFIIDGLDPFPLIPYVDYAIPIGGIMIITVIVRSTIKSKRKH